MAAGAAEAGAGAAVEALRAFEHARDVAGDEVVELFGDELERGAAVPAVGVDREGERDHDESPLHGDAQPEIEASGVGDEIAEVDVEAGEGPERSHRPGAADCEIESVVQD